MFSWVWFVFAISAECVPLLREGGAAACRAYCLFADLIDRYDEQSLGGSALGADVGPPSETMGV